MKQFVIIMGVSGSGKTSVGEAIEANLGWKYIDGDQLHLPSSIKKMTEGIPLNDHDRRPWLDKIGGLLKSSSEPLMIGCSALKMVYRDHIRNAASKDVFFLHLAAPQQVIADRLAVRKGHFMPPELLNSQFAALERLQSHESGTIIDMNQPFERVVQQCQNILTGAN